MESFSLRIFFITKLITIDIDILLLDYHRVTTIPWLKKSPYKLKKSYVLFRFSLQTRCCGRANRLETETFFLRRQLPKTEREMAKGFFFFFTLARQNSTRSPTLGRASAAQRTQAHSSSPSRSSGTPTTWTTTKSHQVNNPHRPSSIPPRANRSGTEPGPRWTPLGRRGGSTGGPRSRNAVLSVMRINADA